MTTLKKLNIINSDVVSKSDVKVEVVNSSVKNIYTCGCVHIKHIQKDSMEDKHDVELCPQHSKLYVDGVEVSFSPKTGVLDIYHDKISILRAQLDDANSYLNSITINEQLFDIKLCRSSEDSSYLLYVIPIVDGCVIAELAEAIKLES